MSELVQSIIVAAAVSGAIAVVQIVSCIVTARWIAKKVVHEAFEDL